MDGSRSSDDKAFQAAGPDVENARGPNVDVSALYSRYSVTLFNNVWHFLYLLGLWCHIPVICWSFCN